MKKQIETFLERKRQRTDQNLSVTNGKGWFLIKNEDIEECLHEIHNSVATLSTLVATESLTVTDVEVKVAAVTVPAKGLPTAIEAVPALATTMDPTSTPSSEVSTATASSAKKRRIPRLLLASNKEQKRTIKEEDVDIITTTAVPPLLFVAVPSVLVNASVEKVSVEAKVVAEVPPEIKVTGTTSDFIICV